jgi:hypothetical protein
MIWWVDVDGIKALMDDLSAYLCDDRSRFATIE